MTRAILPLFKSNQANAPIELGVSDILFSIGDGTYKGKGTARLCFRPDYRVVFSIQTEAVPTKAFFDISRAPVFLRFGNASEPIEVLAINSRLESLSAGCSPINAELLAKSGRVQFCTDRETSLSSMMLHIINFPQFMTSGGRSTDICDPRDGRRRGRVILLNDEWQIEIQEIGDHGLFEQLSAEGGHAITHAARVVRADGRQFTISSAERLLRDLQLFLSLACGGKTALFGATGFDAADRKIFEDWSNQQSDPWGSRSSWFDAHHGESLSELFPGFIKLLRQVDMGKAATRALYWYLNSNKASRGLGIDGGVILSQAALECLAVAYLKQSNFAIPDRAAQKIRAAAESLNLPLALPDEVPYLHAQKDHLNDIPTSIVAVRNQLVHTDRTPKIDQRKAVVEAWNLAQWYIELFLLKLSGYAGLYSKRLMPRWVGQVEPMPWTGGREQQ